MERTSEDPLLDGHIIFPGINPLCFDDKSMGDQKHRFISLEIELRAATEKIQELLNALIVICKERDDARKQCQYLQERLLQSFTEMYNSGLANVAIDSPVARSLNGESIITECDSSSRTRKHHYQSSPADPSVLQALSLMQEPSSVDLSGGDLVQYPCIDISEDYLQSSFPLQNMPPESISLDHNNSDGGRMFSLQQDDMQMNFSSKSLEFAQFYMMENMHDMDSCLPLGSSMISAEQSVQSQGFGRAGLDYYNQGEGVPCQGNVNLQPQISEEILINEPQQQKRIKYDNENQKENSHLENSKNDDAKINVTGHGKSKDESENASSNPSSSGTWRLKSNKTSSSGGAGNAKKRYGEISSMAVPYHLEEPPEADPKVLLKRLPKKGELLEAVKHAGPLLQTLLIQTPHLNFYGVPFDMSMPVPSTHVSLRNPVGPNRIIRNST